MSEARPIALLASVRTLDEAETAVAGGADLIDLKEPRAGALGALPLPLVAHIVAHLRADGPLCAISATVGDLPDDADPVPWLTQQVTAVAATGVDYVKVGIAGGPQAEGLLDALAALPGRRVPVLLADGGLDPALVAQACALRFPVVMVDTGDKRRGSLFDCVSEEALARFVATVRASGLRAGLAGSLQLAHVPRLRRLQPDIAGFRGALCDLGREGELQPSRLAALRAQLKGAPATPPAQGTSAGASSSSRSRGSSSFDSSPTG